MKKYDVIVIGAGPAGLTAAMYTSRANLSTLILDKGIYGGQMNNTANIENYTGFTNVLGHKLGQYMYKSAMKFGAKYQYGNVSKIHHTKSLNTVYTDMGNYQAPVLIFATGAKNRKLGVKGEKEYAGKGVSYCAVCDGNFFKDQPVIVVGGGDSAFTEALYLSHIVSHVDIVIRKPTPQAEPEIVDKVKHTKNIDCIYNTCVKSINGDGKKITNVTTFNKKNNSKQNLKTSAVFIYIGIIPNTQILKKCLPCCIDKRGFIAATSTYQVQDIWNMNSLHGLFVAGDVREKQLRQIVSAVGSGGIVGHNACLELENPSDPAISWRFSE